MKNVLKILLITIFLISCSENEEQNEISEEQLITIGNKLAEWGNSNCSTININTNAVLWQGPNAGGCSMVYFEYLGTDRALMLDIPSYETTLQEMGISEALINSLITGLENNLTNENKVKENLKLALENSTCDIYNLISKMESINEYSDEELIDILNCIGNIGILEGYSSEE